MPNTPNANTPTRGFTNDGKVSTDIVNDSFGTVDASDSTGLDSDLEKDPKTGSNATPKPNGNQRNGR